MKRIALLLSVCTAVVCAEEKVFVGPSGGAWDAPENWSPAGVPGGADVAVFNTAVTVSFPASATYPVGGLVFNAPVTLGKDSATTIADRKIQSPASLVFSAPATAVHVADGVTAKVGIDFFPLEKNVTSFSKTGAGTLHMYGFSGYKNDFAALVVEAGTFLGNWGDHTDGMYAQRMHIKSGARYNAENANLLSNGMRIRIDAGGVYDGGDNYDCIGGIEGEGDAVNMRNTTFSLAASPDYVFSGTLSGIVINIGANNLPNGPQCRFVVASPTGCQNAHFKAYSSLWCEGFAFAPGVGTFRIGSFSVQSETLTLALEDTNGKPIRLETSLGGNPVQGVFAGSGTLAFDKTTFLKSGNCAFGMTGGLGITAGYYLVLSNAAEGTAFDFGDISYMFANRSAFLSYDFTRPFHQPVHQLVDGGNLELRGKGELAFASVAVSNATVSTWKEAGNVTISNLTGKALNLQHDATNGVLTLCQGTVDGLKLTGGSFRLAPIVFDGLKVTDMNFAVPRNSQRHYVFRDGSYAVTNLCLLYATNTVAIEGGELVFDRGVSTYFNPLEKPFTITGGRTIFYHPPAWNQGFGALVSGADTFVKLMNTNRYETNVRTYRLASDGYSHTLCISNNAVVESEDIYLCMPGSTTASTGVLEVVAGGKLRIAGSLKGVGDTNPLAHTRVCVDGGEIAFISPTVGYQPLIGGAQHAFQVGPGGFACTYAPAGLSCEIAVTLSGAMTPKPGDEADGGIVKKGHGRIDINGPSTLTGGFWQKDGAVYCRRSAAPTPLGSGTLTLDGARLVMMDGAAYTAAFAENARVRLNGAVQVTLERMADHAHAASLTLGKSGLAAPGVLERASPGAALMVYDARTIDNPTPFGDGPAKFVVNGGVAANETTGLPLIPVVGLYYDSTLTGDRRVASPLAYDADKGFVAAAQVDDSFAGGASAKVRVRTPTTLGENAAAGALSIFGCDTDALTLADGVTLTLGAGTSPALLLFNNSSSAKCVSCVKGGTIDFGVREGFIAGNFSKGNNLPAEIHSVLTGTGGLTVAGFQDYSPLYAFYGANTYAGDTRINNAIALVRNAEAFSTGCVRAKGAGAFGGALSFDMQMTFANDLYVSGYGPYNGFPPVTTVSRHRGEGALRMSADVTFTGTVTLGEGVTRFTSSKNTTFAGGLASDGATCLELTGVGSYLFGSAGTCTNAVYIDGTSVVRLSHLEGLGSGPVVVAGTLIFDGALSGVFANRLEGTGRIILSGADVSLPHAEAFNGTVRIDDGQCDTQGASYELQRLDGNGLLTNSSPVHATIGMDVAADNYNNVCKGTVGGALSFVKKGEGTLNLSGRHTYTGATEILGGALVLRDLPVSDTLPVPDAVVRLDASALTGYQDGDSVTAWADADARGVSFALEENDCAPQYAAQAVNNRPALWFGAASKTRLSVPSSFAVRSVFAVYRTATGTHGNGKGWTCAGFFGTYGSDGGLRFSSNQEWHDGPGSVWGNMPIRFGIDGVDNTRKFTAGTAAVVSARLSMDRSPQKFAIGDYWGHSTHLRYFYGWISELVIYDRALSDDETKLVSEYLMKKWGVKAFEEPQSVDNVLPTTTDLSIAQGALLDLAGTHQAVQSLSGGGLVTNSATKSAVLTLLAPAKAPFTGRVEGAVTLTLAGGASLDLGEGTVPVSALAGTGRVDGGPVATASIEPGGVQAAGTLVFARAPAPGATYRFEAFGEACDKIVVEDDFDLSTLAFTLSPASRLSGVSYEVLNVTGVRTGETFSQVEGAFRSWGLFHMPTGATLLKNRLGSVIIFR